MLTVTAMDPLFKLAAYPINRAFLNKKDSEIVQDVVGMVGLTAGTVDATTFKNEYYLARVETALSLCKRLAARNGYWLRAREGKVDFMKPAHGAVVEVSADDLTRVDISITGGLIPTKVSVHGWDYVKKEAVLGEGQLSGVVGPGPTKPEGGEQQRLADVQVFDAGVAGVIAKGQMARIADTHVTGSLRFSHLRWVLSGQEVALEGLNEGHNIKALVIGTRHVMEAAGGSYTEVLLSAPASPNGD
jgi:hypothetical protein